MAQKHKKTVPKGEAHAKATPNGNQAQITDPKGTKSGPPADADGSEERTSKRSKPNPTPPDKPTGIPRQSTKRQKPMAMPHGDAEVDFHQAAKRLSIKKRRREDDEGEIISQTPSKRSRQNGNAAINHVPQSQTTGIEDPNPSVAVSTSVSKRASMAEAQVLPFGLQQLGGQYDFSTMSILSSAKIESRVRNLLERVQKFGCANTKGKPGIVILRAKADVASKLCSVVELAKQQVEREKGKWWQYNKLDGELLELKPKQTERTGAGKTLSERSKVQARDGSTDSKAINETEKGSTTGQKGQITDEDDDDLEEPFEVMTNAKLRDREAMQPQSGNGKKVRNTPIMTIIFATVPVPSLKELCRQVSPTCEVIKY